MEITPPSSLEFVENQSRTNPHRTNFTAIGVAGGSGAFSKTLPQRSCKMSDEQSIISHLLELRDRLLRIVMVLVASFIALFIYPGANKLYTWLAQPMLEGLPKGRQMIATAVTTPFFEPMKVAAMTAFLLTLPYTLYQVWSFIAPGMYAHEKRFALPLAITSTLLFFAGMAFAYFAVFPVVFGFISQVAPEGVAVMTDIGSYLDFVLTLFLAFGITFEVPVAVVLLVKMNLLPWPLRN